MKEKYKKIGYYFFAFCIPIIIMLIVYFVLGIYPFGDQTILAADMDHQYISFFAYLQDNITNPGNLIYSLTKTMGGNLVGITGYYLASPLNLILLLFSKANLTEGVLVLTLLKIGLCGLTCSIFFNQDKKYKISNWIFTSAYALMTYNIAYQCNLMWLDSIILLPILFLGIDKLIRENKTMLYTIILALTIITNYYMGFMICLVLLVYFVYQMGVKWNQVEHKKKVMMRFIVHSILGAGIASFLLVPCVFSLQGGKAGFSLAQLEFTRNFTAFGFLSKLFTGNFVYQDIDRSIPLIFCGIMISLLVVLFFFNRNISKREKIAALLLLLFMYVNYQIKGINLIWHGFNAPNSYTFRNAFVLSFFTIIIAKRSYEMLQEGIKIRQLLTVALALILLGGWIGIKSHLSIARLGFDLLLLMSMVVFFSILLQQKGKTKMTLFITIALIAMMLLDLGVNAYFILNKYYYYEKQSYTPYVEKMQPMIEEIKQKDTSIYRMEKDFRRTHNDPYLLGYYGLSNFTSGESVETTNFLKQMGYKTTKVWAYFGDGNTQFANSLLGVKYMLSERQMPESYQKIDSKEGVQIYQNPYALPIMFVADGSIKEVEMQGQENLFALQNEIAKTISQDKIDAILKREQIQNITLVNLEEKQEEEETYYQKKEAEKQAYIQYEIIPSAKEHAMYLYLQTNSKLAADQGAPVDVLVNGKKVGQYFDVYTYGIMPILNPNQEEKLTIQIKLNNDEIRIKEAFFYSEDSSQLATWYQSMKAQQIDFSMQESSSIEASVTINRPNQYIILSIPYDKQWNISIDGKKIEQEKVLQNLLAFPIAEGKHTITMKYTPKGMHLGIGITLTCLFGWILIEWKKGRKQKVSK